MARCASPASVIWSQPLRGSTTQPASVPGLRARFCSMQPQLPGQRLGTSGRPSYIGDDSPEVQALEALDLGQVRQARIGDPNTSPAWEHDQTSSISARPACRFCSMPPQLPGQLSGSWDCPSNIGDDSPEVQALEALDLGQVRQARIGDPLATPAWEHDPSNIGAGPACQILLYATPAARPALGTIGPPQQQKRRLTLGSSSGGAGSWPGALAPHR